MKALRQSDRLTPEDLLVDQDARIVWHTITGEKQGPIMKALASTPMKWVFYRVRRENDRSDPLELLARMMIWMANVGVTEARLRMIPLYLTRVIEECFAGTSHRALAEIDRDEQAAENRENEISIARLTSTSVTAEDFDAQAIADEIQATCLMERARVCKRKARQLRQNLGVLAFPSSVRC